MNDLTVIPDDIAAAVRGAAHAVPASAHELTEVRQRYRRRRSRRIAATAGLATVAVGLAVAALPMIARDVGPGGSGMVDATTTVAARPNRAPAQRLLVTGGAEVPVGGELPFGIVTGPGILEVLPDNSLMRHPVPDGIDVAFDTFAVPDGRLVLLGVHDTKPGVPRRDGTFAAGATRPLVVLRNDGTIESTRDVRRPGEDVRLVGATITTAYLERPSGLVAFDLATGAERPVVPAYRPIPTTIEAGTYRRLDVVDNALGVFDRSPSAKTCDLAVFDLGTGTRVASSRLTFPPGCASNQFRLSPDGRSAALIYGKLLNQGRDGEEQWLSVVDVATGAVRQDQLLYRESPKMIGKPWSPKAATGLAWTDSATLRVATANLPATDRKYTVDELLKVETVHIG